jgi:SAM-dependent methyltransferase
MRTIIASSMQKLDTSYWQARYEQGQTGWDLGAPSPPLKAYIDQLTDKSLRILVPGAGYGHEVAYLWEQGFAGVEVVDVASAPLDDLARRLPAMPAGQRRLGDFFTAPLPAFDLILEQTFFCAIDPALRPAYARRMFELLRPGGKLAGVLFDTQFAKEGPPFGGSAEEYRAYFAPYFRFRHYAPCHNSIPPRAGNELFVVLERLDAPLRNGLEIRY